jgi:amino acid adenylation domain-containing protein
LLVDSCLERSARAYEEKIALVCDGRRLTYRELNDAANRFASGLKAAGVRRGDTVVIHLENSVEAVVSIFGTLRAGAVFVPVGPTVKVNKLAYILEDAAATVLVADQRAEAVVDHALKSTTALRVVVVVGDGPLWLRDSRVRSFTQLLADAPPVRLIPPGIDLDLSALVYTSGSTGSPKGVMLSHANMMAAATSIGQYLENTQDDVILDVLPLSFDYGLYQLFLAFNAGATLILERSFVYPAVMLELIEREQVTGLPLVPTLVALLLKYDIGTLARSLRYITNTGAALPLSHIKALRAQLPSVRIFSMYGLTECKRVSFLSPEEIDERPTSVGKPMDNVEVFVADERGNLQPTGTGELVVRGSNVMVGYWRAEEATDAILRPGPYPGQRLLWTGDRFRIDDDGYMYYIGRLDDMIKSRGQRVSPKEVEDVIYSLVGVNAVGVVGVPDPILGMAVIAYVSADRERGLTEQDVLRHCAQYLEDHMVPKTVTFVDELLKTSAGKIDRRRLRESAKDAPSLA